MHRYLIYFLFFIFYFFSACMTSLAAPYPEDWPSLGTMAGSDCPDVSGYYYLNAKKTTQKPSSGGIKRLDGVVFEKYLNDFSKDASAFLKFSKNENLLTLDLLNSSNQKSPGYVALVEQYLCTEGWLQSHIKSEWHSEGNTQLRSSFVKIRKAPDKSLFVHVRTVNKTRSFLIFSFVENVDEWYLFEEISSSSVPMVSPN